MLSSRKRGFVYLLIFFLAFSFLSWPGYAQEAQGMQKPEHKTIIVHFYGRGCPHCASMHAFLEELKQKYPSLEIREYEIYYDNKNRELLIQIAQAYGSEVKGVPTLFINDRMFVGFSPGLKYLIEQEVKRCIDVGCIDPEEKIANKATYIEAERSPAEEPGKTELLRKLTIPAVLSAAAVDAINPCAFAVLIILISTILVAKGKKKALGAGLAFSASIYISYLLMGIGLFSAIVTAGIARYFYAAAACLAIVVGLFNLKDYLWYGKWFVTEVPLTWRPKLKMLLRGITSIPGAFLIGFLVSLFLLPCTSGPYIVILGLLAKAATRSYAFILLILYNLVFILPMLGITVAVSLGMLKAQEAEEWRKRKIRTLHLVAGCIILALGVGMLIALAFGFV